jgi:hypothetical protein
MYCANCLKYFTTNKTKRIIPEYYADVVKNKELKKYKKEVRYCENYVWCSNKCYKEWCKTHKRCGCRYKKNPMICNLIKKLDKNKGDW